MEIPYEKLSEDILNGIIEEFVLQEGTDYGHTDYTLESKIEAVKKQLAQGTVIVTFDPETETAHLVRR